MNEYNEIKALRKYFSTPRLHKFWVKADGDPIKAFELYKEDMLASAGLYPAIACFEICLRNAINEEMILDYGIEWLINPQTPLLDVSRQRIEDVRAKLSKNKIDTGTPSERMGKIIVGLSLGFWVELLTAKYKEALWRSTLYRAFPNYTGKIRPLLSKIYRIRNLRNSIAHHEQILFSKDVDIETIYDEILEVIGWMSEDVRDWVARMHDKS